jgi:hypothetical protein
MFNRHDWARQELQCVHTELEMINHLRGYPAPCNQFFTNQIKKIEELQAAPRAFYLPRTHRGCFSYGCINLQSYGWDEE